MDERYRLIFRGELLDGQHRAVVKRRLAELLKLQDAQVDRLFGGKPVILKRDVDRETAARYQALFKKAGGRLRVSAANAADSSGHAEAGPAPSAAPDAGSDTGKEAPAFEVQSTWFPPPAEPRGEIEAPDYSIAAVGSDLSDAREDAPPPAPDVDFELAEVGVDLLTERSQIPVVEVGPLDFEVAEVGADIGSPSGASEARAPDVSHIALVENS